MEALRVLVAMEALRVLVAMEELRVLVVLLFVFVGPVAHFRGAIYVALHASLSR